MARIPRVPSGRPILVRHCVFSGLSARQANPAGFLDLPNTLQFVRFSLLHAPFLQS